MHNQNSFAVVHLLLTLGTNMANLTFSIDRAMSMY